MLGRELSDGDYLILASKASVSHIMKLAKVEKIKPDGDVVVSSIENDWRGYRYNKASKLKSKEEALFVLKNNEVPQEIIAGFIRPLIRENNKDFFNQDLEIGRDYLVAKHIKNSSILQIGTLDSIGENKIIFIDRDGNRFSTSKASRVVKI